MRVEELQTEILVHFTLDEAQGLAKDRYNSAVVSIDQMIDDIAEPFQCSGCGDVMDTEFICRNTQCEESPDYDPDPIEDLDSDADDD